MTAVLPAVADAPEAVTDRRRRPILAVLPWALPAAVAVAGLVQTGTPVRDIAVYAVYFALAVVLPGTLVYRAFRGSRGNWPEDLGLGAATGMLTMLAGWALAAATGLQVLLPGWPLLVIVLFLAVPGLRRHWRITEPLPLPVAWSWIISGALLAAVLIAYAWWRITPLPPATTDYYQDLMYHLALVHEMTRSMPFQVPQVAGDTLRYHYLSDADMATGSMVTGIAPATVLLRLWIVPVAGTAIFVTAAFARDLTGKWWAGALGGALTLAGLPLSFGAPAGAPGGSALVPASPSQTYALPLLGLLLMLAVEVLRGGAPRRAWLLVFPLALACAGAKSSSLPPVLAGLLAAAAFVFRYERTRLRAVLGFLGLTGAAMLAGTKLFAGGGAGILGLQPLALFYWFAPYKQTLGRGDQIDGTRILPAGVEHAGATGAVFLAGLICWALVMQAPRLLGLTTVVTRWRDPVTWLLAGLTTSALGAAWLLWHPSLSQMYFYLGVVPFAAVLTVRLLADRAGGWRPVLAGVLAGGLWAAFAPRWTAPRGGMGNWAWALAGPVLLTLLVAVAVAGLGLLVWRRVSGRYALGALPVALIAAVLGASLGGGAGQAVRGADKALTDPRPPKTLPDMIVSKQEMTAALWLGDHSGRDDVIATNVHCRPMSWKVCDARGFWVTGLSGRRTLVEGWGYTDQAVARDGENGKRYTFQPAPYPERFALNQRVFATGSAADVAALRDTYHVRWLVADSRAAGGVSPNLARVATERYRSGTVTIFELA